MHCNRDHFFSGIFFCFFLLFSGRPSKGGYLEIKANELSDFKKDGKN